MPTLRAPFIGSYNNRSFVTPAGKDQFAKGCTVTPIVNKQSRTVTYYVEKRLGTGTSTTELVAGLFSIGAYPSPSTLANYYAATTALNGSVARLYYSLSSTILCGTFPTASGVAQVSFDGEVVISGVTYILFTHADPRTAWFLPSDALTGLTFTGDTHTNTTIDNVSSLTGLYVGQAISGTGIAANTRIATISAPSTITTTIATTGTASITVTREAMAKIIDADFPANAGQTIVGGLAELDAWVEIMTESGRVYNSDLNSVVSWTASNYLTCQKYSDNGVGVMRYKQFIVAFSNASIEFLYNAGNASGSPFSSSDQVIKSRAISPRLSILAANCNDTLYWLGKDSNVWWFEGQTPKSFSTLGTALNNLTTSVTTQMTAFHLNGKPYLNILTGATSNVWYSINDEIILDPVFTAGAYLFNDSDNRYTAFVLLRSNFIIGGFSITSPTFVDANATLTMSGQVAFDDGTQKRKFYDELRLLADVQASGVLSVSLSYDDGATYTAARDIPLTSIGAMKLTRLGSGKGVLLLKYEHTANAAFRGKLFELDYTLGR